MKKRKTDLICCPSCSWIHFEVDNKFISDWKKMWDEFWPTLDEDSRKSYGVQTGPPKPDSYYKCFKCGENYKNMIDYNINNPDMLGNTIQPILGRQYNKNKDWNK